MLKLIQILWPSFLVAGAAAIATYSIGFFAFWIVCAASSLTTLFFQRTSNEINQSDSI